MTSSPSLAPVAAPARVASRPGPAASRNATVDLCRLLAAFGVITIHVHSSTPVAQTIADFFWPLCVPFFYAASLLYFVAGLPKAPTTKIISRAGARLAVPYLVWTAIYTSLLLAKQLLLGGGTHDFSWWRILLYGESAVHLYFLPTLLLLQALALGLWLLLGLGGGAGRRAPGAALLAGAAAYLAWGIAHRCFGVAAPGELLAIAAYLGLAFGLAPRLSTGQSRPALATLGVLMAAGAVAANLAGHPCQVLGYPLVLPLGGCGLLLLAFGLPRPGALPGVLGQLAAWSFGIYLSHVVFLEAFELLTKRLLPPAGLSYTAEVKLAVTALIFVAAAFFTWVAGQMPIGRRLLLGERT